MSSMVELIEMSNRYGKDPAFVLAGGGNTSLKEGNTLYIKGSGTSLATIAADGFVRMDIERLDAMWHKDYGDDLKIAESAVLRDMMDARRLGEEHKRPSVETLLHALIPFRLVLHLHPARVNGMTCSQAGAAAAKRLFPDALFMPACKPGYILAKHAKAACGAFAAKNGKFPSVIFMENHGVFFGADTLAEMDAVVQAVMQTLTDAQKKTPDVSPSKRKIDKDALVAAAVTLRSLYGRGGRTAALTHVHTVQIERLIASETKCLAAVGLPFTPDHIVYTGIKPLYLSAAQCHTAGMAAAFDAFASETGALPKVVFVEGLGMFCLGASKKEADIAAEVYLDEIAIAVYAEAFGGPKFMTDEDIAFIASWEVESYRKQVSLGGAAARMKEKIAVVTGGAQGYGYGIAEALLQAGANVVIADINADGVTAAAARLNAAYGKNRAAGVATDVSDEWQVAHLCEVAAVFYGGIDLFVANAGIVRAGGLDEMTLPNFELVTKINYNAYFLCAKYASKIMKTAGAADPDAFYDIVQINSKSGLAGSNKNFAYAGSKFGGVGLTQSFALELAPFRIKVNAICPGNFLDGPLWSDPEKGLFVQYLAAGKVKGAKTVEDVKRAYEQKVPLLRGCKIEDVARALFYIVEQQYETGQAIPVTGGQEMLN